MRPAAPSTLWSNLLETLSATFGRLWIRHVAPFYAHLRTADWLLALAAALALTVLGLWLLQGGAEPSSGAARVLLLSVLFYFAAYFPILLWYVSHRHHYLPSIGLFAGGAAILAWMLERVRLGVARAMVCVLGVAACAFAAASRGEARLWEDSFAMKKQLFAELEPDLASKDVLVLEDFPLHLGPAYVIFPQDVNPGARFLYRGDPPLGPRFQGDVSAAFAPGGLFLATLTYLHGSESFRYYPTDRFLIARFRSVENRRLRFEKIGPQPPPYQIVSSSATPKQGPFGVAFVSGRREGPDTLVSLRLQSDLQPRTYLTAVLKIFYQGGFHRWGALDRQGALKLLPVLLSDPGPNPRSGSYQWDVTLRLLGFPETPRIEFDFYAARQDNPPVLLGRAEAAVEP